MEQHEKTEKEDALEDQEVVDTAEEEDATREQEIVDVAPEDCTERQDIDAERELRLGEESTDPASRLRLFEQAQALHNCGEDTAALRCYLQCLKGLEAANGFAFLPQCLRHVAEIYFKREEYEKAVQFVQAEKMYYETALIDTSEMQQKLVEKQNEGLGQGDTGLNLPQDSPDLLRADEYENLAKMCLDKNQPRLALEYQGKATKLRQQLVGEDHPITAKSLDVFTAIYGAVGKQQYSESMQKLSSSSRDETNDESETSVSNTSTQTEGLRHRRGRNNQDAGLERASQGDDLVTQADLGPSLEIQEQEEWISKIFLWILFFMCIGAVSAILFYLYCKIDTASPSCRAWRADLHYYYMRIKYLFYYYTSTDKIFG